MPAAMPYWLFSVQMNSIKSDPGGEAFAVNFSWTGRETAPGSELMEFICTENNQYGLGLGIQNHYRETGFGLEVRPGDRK